jgi:hypothetical protein
VGGVNAPDGVMLVQTLFNFIAEGGGGGFDDREDSSPDRLGQRRPDGHHGGQVGRLL